jgi:hypothetical protein
LGELQRLVEKAEFPIKALPAASIRDEGTARQVAGADADVIVLYAASGGTNIVNTVASSKIPMIIFIRHRSGPFHLWYEIAHWRFLRQNGDTFAAGNTDTLDIVIDYLREIGYALRELGKIQWQSYSRIV